MTLLVFVIIAAFGAVYFAGWLINIGIWMSRKTVPSAGALWLPLFIGVIFIGFDIYGFTIFPNNTPRIAIPLLAVFTHSFLFFGTIVQARSLAKHRCPVCGGWMEIERTSSNPSMDEVDIITITKKCVQCDFEESVTEKSIEGMGHTIDMPKYGFYDEDEESAEKDEKVEHIDAKEIEN